MGKVLLDKVLWEYEGQKETMTIMESFRGDFVEIKTELCSLQNGEPFNEDKISISKGDALSLAKWIIENIEEK